MELVAATVNTMLTGASPARNGKAPSAALKDVKGIGNPHHFLAGGQGALPQNSQGRPWNGDYVFSSGDLGRMAAVLVDNTGRAAESGRRFPPRADLTK